ncbi:MAG TPA: tripartite tricarboxylate transporter substrate binding protein [Burkholderiales bacterium]|nr:tripartite tricarboxylate transporter substrate binding protein [Burkholderiales bacterium]
MKGSFKIAGAVLTLAVSGAAHSQSYPSKPVRIEVGYTPGGGVDTTARMVGQALGDLWGSPVVIENRPGAAGNVATEYTAKAPPDGFTLVLCNIGSHAVTPARFAKKLTYDPIRDFAFPSMIGGVPNLFMVHPSFPAKNLKQFIAYAKAHPGKVNYGSSGVGASPHLSIELLKLMTGINIVHVPYKGASGALTDAISGQIEASVGNLAGAPLAAAKSGRVRPLGVTSARRNAQLPDVPTFAEAGVPGYDVTGWYGICTQSKVPQPIVSKLTADLHKVLAGPLKARLEEQGVEVTPTTPEQFVAHVKSEIEKWTKVVSAAKLEGD